MSPNRWFPGIRRRVEIPTTGEKNVLHWITVCGEVGLSDKKKKKTPISRNNNTEIVRKKKLESKRRATKRKKGLS